MTISVLFARHDSVYKTLPVDVFDKDRDARTFTGGTTVIAHPPCRAWGRLRHFAKPEPGEMQNGLWAVDQVRQNGGVLEHPSGSLLFFQKKLPLPGQGQDIFGGFTLPIDQYWFGHKARKRTWLYTVGISVKEIPRFPFRLGEAPYICGGSRCKLRPEITKAEREHTPKELAVWLISLCHLIHANRDINHGEGVETESSQPFGPGREAAAESLADQRRIDHGRV